MSPHVFWKSGLLVTAENETCIVERDESESAICIKGCGVDCVGRRALSSTHRTTKDAAVNCAVPGLIVAMIKEVISAWYSVELVVEEGDGMQTPGCPDDETPGAPDGIGGE